MTNAQLFTADNASRYNWKAAGMADKTIADMVGKTPVRITEYDQEKICFEFSDGTACLFYHWQQCCEDVSIEDVNGDWSDLLNSPILVADERINSEEGNCRSDTWTFYTFRGLHGPVDVRWHGESNGYYSESVDFSFGTWIDIDGKDAKPCE